MICSCMNFNKCLELCIYHHSSRKNRSVSFQISSVLPFYCQWLLLTLHPRQPLYSFAFSGYSINEIMQYIVLWVWLLWVQNMFLRSFCIVMCISSSFPFYCLLVLPGEPQGRGSLAGCHLGGCTELDATEAT